MAVKIPQDVTREDRLIGPLTLRQFLFVLIGSAIIFLAWESYVSYYLFLYEFVFIAFIVGLLTFALTFAKINGQSFGVFLIHLYRFIASPKQVIWHKDPRAKLPTMKVRASDLKDTKTEAVERKNGQAQESEIEKLASILDTGGTIKAEQHSAVTSPINNLNFVAPGSQFKDLDVEDILTDED